MDEDPKAGPARAVDVALLAVALLAGAAIRILPAWPVVFAGPGAVLLATDPWYHLRRIQHAVRHFPTIFDFDPSVNFPEGAQIIWPHGFDLLLASAARLLLHPATPGSIERLCALAIPILGVVTIVAAWSFGRASLLSPGAGVTALGTALLPYPVAYGLLGYVDHHVMEPLFLCAAGTLLLSALTATRLRAGLLGAAAGAVAAFSCWFVTDGPAIVALLCAPAVFEGMRGRLPGARVAGAAAISATALVIAALSRETSWGRSGEFTYLALSPLQAHLAWAGAGIALGAIAATNGSWRMLPRSLAASLGFLIALAALATGGAKLLDPLRDAYTFLSRSEGFASIVGESMPLWNKPLPYLALRLSPLGLVTPFVLVWAAIQERGRIAGAAALVALAAFGMGLVQMRFMVMGSLGIAWAAGWLTALAWKSASHAVRPFAWRTATLAVMGGCLAMPHGWRPIRVEKLAPDTEQLALARSLRDRAAGLRVHSGNTPPWGVIAPWGLGHLLLYRAGVPVVACPFGQAPWHERGLRRASLFDLAASDEEAAAMARRLRVRYVVTMDPFSTVIGDARIAGVSPGRYLAGGAGKGAGTQATAPFRETAAFRLHLLDGSAAGSEWSGVSGMPSFRLIWESEGLLERNIVLDVPAGGIRPSAYKVFEVVKGARVEGRCDPGKPVEIRVGARTNVRAFEWRDEIRCGAAGRYTLRTPYPSQDVRVSEGRRVVTIGITEAQVREGEASPASRP